MLVQICWQQQASWESGLIPVHLAAPAGETALGSAVRWASSRHPHGTQSCSAWQWPRPLPSQERWRLCQTWPAADTACAPVGRTSPRAVSHLASAHQMGTLLVHEHTDRQPAGCILRAGVPCAAGAGRCPSTCCSHSRAVSSLPMLGRIQLAQARRTYQTGPACDACWPKGGCG